jgi:hypothetical protein
VLAARVQERVLEIKGLTGESGLAASDAAKELAVPQSNRPTASMRRR